jgi:hypothetical protein
MKELKAFIDNQNSWNRIFKAKDYEINTAKGRQAVADMIDGKLSPENLSCDGELSRAQVHQRWKELITVAKQLQKLDPSVKIYELYTGE